MINILISVSHHVFWYRFYQAIFTAENWEKKKIIKRKGSEGKLWVCCCQWRKLGRAMRGILWVKRWGEDASEEEGKNEMARRWQLEEKSTPPYLTSKLHGCGMTLHSSISCLVYIRPSPLRPIRLHPAFPVRIVFIIEDSNESLYQTFILPTWSVASTWNLTHSDLSFFIMTMLFTFSDYSCLVYPRQHVWICALYYLTDQ